MTHYYQLGKLNFTISGIDRILPHLLRELGSIQIQTASRSVLNFEFVTQLKPLENYIDIPTLRKDIPFVRATKDCYELKYNGLTYQVSHQPNSVEVKIKSSPSILKLMMPAIVGQTINRDYLSAIEKIARNFLYEVFDYLSQIVQVPLGQSYLHATSLKRGDRGVVVIGEGGAGKTYSTVRLVANDGWQYLCDDLSLIDDSGTLWKTPKYLKIGAYHLRNNPELEEVLLADCSKLEQAAWLWYRRTGVRRHVAPEKLYGSSLVAEKAQLTDAFLIERFSGEEFQCVPISAEEIAASSALLTRYELQPFGEISAALHETKINNILPTHSYLDSMTIKVLNNAFKTSNNWMIKVPNQANPEEFTKYLRYLLKSN